MHSIEEIGTNVPAFLAKLWKIVEDPETNDLICWSPSGQSFYIRNQARFARELLPLYYKHNNMASFVRQLNMYGFHKVVSIEGGGLKVDKDEMEFAHHCFLMGHPYLLEHIKRKIPTTKVEEGCSGTPKPELMNKVLADVKSMKGRQESLDNQLSAMKRENEVLWREVAILRQKHLKQQQIVNKLIQFLVSMVQPSRNGGIGLKRHYPLMLNDTSHRPSKVSKLRAELSDLSNAPNSMSPTGPVIHEIDAAELFEECEQNPEGTTAEENFLNSDLCNVVINADNEGQSLSSSSNQIRSGTPDPTTSNPSPEVLLELAEECPLSPNILLTASPLEVNPAIVTPRLSKGKLRTRVSSTENRKRKSKNVTTNGNAENTSSISAVTVNHEVDPLAINPEEAINGVDLLDVVLPTLVTGKAANVLEKEVSNETENKETEMASDPLADATNAAITAINKVAASRNKTSKSTSLLNGKNVSKTGVNGILPVMNDSRKMSITGGKTDAIKNLKLTPSDIMVFKQEPSTSSGKDAHSSNMILACTGNNSGESINRCGIPNELDNHVDNMQNELDNLRDLLKGDCYNLDANTLLGVCASIPGFEQDFIKLFEDPLSELPNTVFENFSEEQEKEGITGNELTTYSSNLLDMVDMCDDGPETGVWSSPATPDASNIMDVSLSELNTPQMQVVRSNLRKTK